MSRIRGRIERGQLQGPRRNTKAEGCQEGSEEGGWPPATFAGLDRLCSEALILLFPSAPALAPPARPPRPPAARPHALLSPQVDELMRQELKALHLAVDREEGRPLKPPKAG